MCDCFFVLINTKWLLVNAPSLVREGYDFHRRSKGRRAKKMLKHKSAGVVAMIMYESIARERERHPVR